MEKIIIFGATGNIGAYFLDYCMQNLDLEKYELVAVGRKETHFFDDFGIKYLRVDIEKPEDMGKLPRKNVFAVVHLAGILPAYSGNVDVYHYMDVNIVGSIRILEYARECGADRVVYAQTWAVLAGYWGKESVLSPKLPRKLKYTGDHAFYSITKNMVEDALEYYHKEHGIKNFVFRLPNVYLYHPKKEYYVDGKKRYIGYRRMIDLAIEGKPIELWGDPDAYKDILYIKDLCGMMCRALMADVDGGTYNAGTGRKTTLREQIDGIISVFSPDGLKSSIIERPDKESFTSFVMDVGNIIEDLGYNCKYTYIDYLKDYKAEQERKRFDSLWTR